MYTKSRNAFTVIELVFVIVVLGILASIAIPKLAATRDDAHVAKARATIAAVRSGIVNERQLRLFRGDPDYINKLDSGSGASQPASGIIFDNNGSSGNTILMYGVGTGGGSGKWSKTGANEYTIRVNGFSSAAVFSYDPTDGTFTCASNDLCNALTR